MYTSSVTLSNGNRLEALNEAGVDSDFPEKGVDRLSVFNLLLKNKNYVIIEQPKMYRNFIGSFCFQQLPGCCGIVVSTGTFLNPLYRGTEVSQKFRDLKTQVAKELGYSAMIATSIIDDVPAHKNLLKSGYEIVKTFNNSRTANNLEVGIKVL